MRSPPDKKSGRAPVKNAPDDETISDIVTASVTFATVVNIRRGGAECKPR